jgi:coatomer protein complex subunit alpha (xenin)
VTKLPIYAFIGIDNLGTVFNEPLDLSEALFKQALFEKNTDYIQHAMTSQKHLGDSMVSYLFKKNHSSLAMNLVVDKKGIKSMKRPARFQLAISSSNLEVAFRMCSELKE